MFREALIHKCVIGVQQLKHTAILAKNTFKKELRLALKSLTEIVVKMKQQLWTRLQCRDIPDV